MFTTHTHTHAHIHAMHMHVRLCEHTHTHTHFHRFPLCFLIILILELVHKAKGGLRRHFNSWLHTARCAHCERHTAAEASWGVVTPQWTSGMQQCCLKGSYSFSVFLGEQNWFCIHSVCHPDTTIVWMLHMCMCFHASKQVFLVCILRIACSATWAEEEEV